MTLSTKSNLINLYFGYGFFPIYLIGFALVSGYIPIIPPSWDAGQITAYFEQHHTALLIGQTLCVIASSLLVPWAVAIFSQMSRLGPGVRSLSYLQLGSGVLGVVFFMVPSFIWLTMAYRTGRDPATMLFMNDFAWITWAVSWPTFAIQAVAISLCVLMNKAEQTIFPRWAAYVSAWLGVSMIPASVTVFFYTGPFAWNGLIAVYLPLVLYTTWWHVIFFCVQRAMKDQQRQDAPGTVLQAEHA